MAFQTPLPALLDSLTQSLTSAFEATHKLSGIEPPQNGVSLLDSKNELLLSYLQNLVFLILLKIRDAKRSAALSDDDDKESNATLSGAVTEKLVELRLYLEKGVRPLEEKLRYQLDKILRAADDADRNAQLKPTNGGAMHKSAESGSPTRIGDESDEAVDNGHDSMVGPRKLTDKQAAPVFNRFLAPPSAVGMATADKDKTGVYRPPKFAATVMPTTERRERRDRRPMKSATMEEYIANELSTAPLAEPSVGTTIVSGGRKIKTATERAEEDRRRNYEESNFVRLPKESKKDRVKRNKTEGRSSNIQFGGEDWRDLGEGVDRIERMTRRKEGSSGGTKALLEKSRKRGRDTMDSNRGSGLNESTREIGDRFQKRLKVLEGGRRDRGKR
ncbi:Sas10/Utp3/C1D family protein [Xylariales sp. AK1849]|nr:Sas10/Utp3/C1D family protein [Xylariales sp. AK1849]